MHKIICGISRELIYEAWNNASDKQRRAIMWQQVDYDRKKLLADTILRMPDNFAIVNEEGKPIALTWLERYFLGQATGGAHFFYCGPRNFPELLSLAICMRDLWLERVSMVLAMVPRPFIGAHELLKKIGFTKLAMLKKMQMINGKPQDMVLWKCARGDV